MLLDTIQNEGYGFVYVGKSKLDKFKALGFYSETLDLQSAGFGVKDE